MITVKEYNKIKEGKILLDERLVNVNLYTLYQSEGNYNVREIKLNGLVEFTQREIHSMLEFGLVSIRLGNKLTIEYMFEFKGKDIDYKQVVEDIANLSGDTIIKLPDSCFPKQFYYCSKSYIKLSEFSKILNIK